MVVVVVVAVIVAIAARGNGSPSGGGTATPSATPAGTAILSAVSNVSPAVLASVGNGGIAPTFTPLQNAKPLTGSDGRPRILYVGADYCPYCAAAWSSR
jgi:hypothetical protein